MALTWATGDIGCPDHLDIPAAPDARLEATVPLIEALPWEIILLSGVAEEAVNVARVMETFASRGCVVRRTHLDSCPYVELPSCWEKYLGGMSSTRRQTIRRKERKLVRDHAMVVTDYAPERLEEGWCHLRSLHQQRWAGDGALGEPRIGGLLRRFSSELAVKGEVWLTTLDLNGGPVAAWYGFARGDTVYFYQGGRDPKWESQSVDLVLMAAMIRRAIERGFRRFDFLRGREAYKYMWTSTERPIYEIVVFRPGWRGARLRALDLAARARARLRDQRLRRHRSLMATV